MSLIQPSTAHNKSSGGVTGTQPKPQRQQQPKQQPQQQQSQSQQHPMNEFIPIDTSARDELADKIEQTIQTRTQLQQEQMLQALVEIVKLEDEIDNLQGISFDEKGQIRSQLATGFDEIGETLGKYGVLFLGDIAAKRGLSTLRSSGGSVGNRVADRLEQAYKRGEQEGQALLTKLEEQTPGVFKKGTWLKGKITSFLEKFIGLQTLGTSFEIGEGLFSSLEKMGDIYNTETNKEFEDALGYTWYNENINSVPVLGDILEFIGVSPLYRGFADATGDMSSLLTRIFTPSQSIGDRRIYEGYMSGINKLLNEVEDLDRDVWNEVESLARESLRQKDLDEYYYDEAEEFIDEFNLRTNPYNDFNDPRLVRLINQDLRLDERLLQLPPRERDYIQRKINERIRYLISGEDEQQKMRDEFQYYDWDVNPLGL